MMEEGDITTQGCPYNLTHQQTFIIPEKGHLHQVWLVHSYKSLTHSH